MGIGLPLARLNSIHITIRVCLKHSRVAVNLSTGFKFKMNIIIYDCMFNYSYIKSLRNTLRSCSCVMVV